MDGTVNVPIAARDAKVKRVVYAASSSAYGDTPTLPKREDMAPNPISPYAVSEAGERILHGIFLPVLWARNREFAVFQYFRPETRSDSLRTREFWQSSSRKCCEESSRRSSAMASKAATSRTWRTRSTRNMLAASAPAEQAAGRMFNVATGTRASLNETFEALKKITGYTGKPQYQTEREGDVKHSLADIYASAECPGIHAQGWIRRRAQANRGVVQERELGVRAPITLVI